MENNSAEVNGGYDTMLRIWNNPNRFLRSVQPWFHGNPQPSKTWKQRMVARLFNSTRRKGRVVRPFKLFIPKSSGALK